MYLFNEGTHSRLYEKLGAHVLPDGERLLRRLGAQRPVRLGHRRLQRLGQGPHTPSSRAARSGIWEGTVPDASEGSHYKYHVASRFNGYTVDKVDPFGFMHDVPPVQRVDRPQARLHLVRRRLDGLARQRGRSWTSR